MIEVSGISKAFGNTKALDNVDLTVQRGTVLGLLGPNGAGKTTLVRVLATLLRPDSGSARINGVDVLADPQSARELIGLAGQYAAVDELLTGRENLVMVGRLYGLSKQEAVTRATDVLARLSLTDAADRPVRTYSGGMRRRLDLGASLVGRPIVLTLDEPTTGLDPRTRAELWGFLKDLVATGTTVLLTTQYLEEADALADRIAIIDHGHIVREGKPSDLKRTVGDPTLLINVSRTQNDAAKAVLARFGELRPTAEGTLGVGLKGGAERVAEVVRALDEAKVVVEHLELNQPSLDDVFAEATGYRLEGADNAPQAR